MRHVCIRWAGAPDRDTLAYHMHHTAGYRKTTTGRYGDVLVGHEPGESEETQVCRGAPASARHRDGGDRPNRDWAAWCYLDNEAAAMCLITAVSSWLIVSAGGGDAIRQDPNHQHSGQWHAREPPLHKDRTLSSVARQRHAATWRGWRKTATPATNRTTVTPANAHPSGWKRATSWAARLGSKQPRGCESVL